MRDDDFLGIIRHEKAERKRIMGKVVNIDQAATKEQRLQDVSANLDELKKSLEKILDEYEEKNADEKKLDALTEALDALEDAYEAVEEVLLDER